MCIRNKLAILMVSFLATLLFAGTASAQAGAACSGTSCGLGGQIRGQVGDGLALPISIAPAQGGSGSTVSAGPFTAITIQSGPASGAALPLVGQGLGQPGQVKPGPLATIMQTTMATGSNPRQLTLAPGVFQYGGQPQGSLGVVNFNLAVFAVQTNLSYATPHPGTTALGAPAFTNLGAAVPTAAANVFAAGGRVGASLVSFYANATTAGPGSPTNNYGATQPQIPIAGQGGTHSINGLARFSSTGNQFGGQAIGRALGTVKVFFNQLPGGLPGGNLVPSLDLPCKVTATPGQGTTAQGPLVPFHTGTACQFALSVIDLTGSDQTVGVAGGQFGGFTSGPAFMTATGFHTGTIGFNGTIINQGAPVTAVGAGIPVSGQAIQTIGFPYTTGMLSITVDLVVGATSEMFVRTGTDARDAAGNGVVALVSGSMSARAISSGNANRSWITLEIPEPSAILAASAGLFALFGCHRLARRRS